MKRLEEKYSEISKTSDSDQLKNDSSYPPARKKKKKKKKAVKIILGILIFFLLLIIIAAVALFIMINSGKKDLLNYNQTDIKTVDDALSEDQGKTIRYNGKVYKLDENITSIACLGIDKEEINQNGIVGSAGQADTIMVIAFDTQTGEAKLISIPRDTITEIDIYAKDGSFLKTEETQVCLAFAYGDGGQSSSENVIASVQKLMFGIPINSFAAMDLNGIAALNDAVGGVTVTSLETMGDFKKGEQVLLRGDMAMRYVRERDTSKLDSNVYRMQRQVQYVKEFTKAAVQKVSGELSSISKIYNTAMNYAYTNIDLNKASYLASRFISRPVSEFEMCSVPGKVIEGDDGYAEFHVDEEEFYELILTVYYDVVGTY